MAHEDSITYGVNFESPLNELCYFHVANFQLPQDIMHLMLEGVVTYEMKLMLTEFIKNDGYFTLSFLNDRIVHFPYSFDEIADKPSPLKEQVFVQGSRSKFHH